MGSIAQYLNPSMWGGSLRASFGGDTAFWIGVLQILSVDLLLSGDNAVVIAMACRGLPSRQRFWGVVVGVTLAVALRIVFTIFVAQLMQLPYLKLIGGLALLYIAAKLLAPEEPDKDDVEAAAHLWGAIRIVIVADTVMSLDNIIPIAAVARGNLLLLVIGLAGTIPLIVAGASFILALLDRMPILVWAGAALLGWIAGEVIATDPIVIGHVSAGFSESVSRQIETAAAGAGALLVIAVGGLLRRLHKSKPRSEPSEKGQAPPEA